MALTSSSKWGCTTRFSMRSCIVTWSVFCLEISSFMTLLYASVLWFCHLFGGFPRPAATRTGRNMHFFILSNKGQRRPSLEWSHLVNASGHWRLVTFSSLSNCSSEVQSKRPIILLPSYSEPRSSRAISLPMISLYVKHLKSWTGRPEQSMVLGLRTGNLKAIILPDLAAHKASTKQTSCSTWNLRKCETRSLARKEEVCDGGVIRSA